MALGFNMYTFDMIATDFVCRGRLRSLMVFFDFMPFACFPFTLLDCLIASGYIPLLWYQAHCIVWVGIIRCVLLIVLFKVIPLNKKWYDRYWIFGMMACILWRKNAMYQNLTWFMIKKFFSIDWRPSANHNGDIRFLHMLTMLFQSVPSRRTIFYRGYFYIGNEIEWWPRLWGNVLAVSVRSRSIFQWKVSLITRKERGALYTQMSPRR